MPPAGLPRSVDATYEAFATHLETELARAGAAKPNPGRTVLHRLNRAEYVDAIRDLLDLEIDPETFLPPDASSARGFDNLGEVLTFSPLLMERYLSAAKQISLLAIGDPATAPVVATYKIPENFEQQDRVSEDLSFGSRGGIAIRHYFPVDAEYFIRIRLQRIGSGNYAGQVIGMEEQKQLEVRLDGARVKLLPVGGGNKGEDLEVPVSVKAGMRLLGVAFLKDTVKQEGVLRRGSGAACPTRNCWNWPPAAAFGRRRCWSSRYSGCSATLDLRRWRATSPSSGSRFATFICCRLQTRPCFLISQPTFATPCSKKWIFSLRT